MGINVYSFSSAPSLPAAGVTLTFDAEGNSSDFLILKDTGSMTLPDHRQHWYHQPDGMP